MSEHKFSRRSLDILITCDTELQLLFLEVVKTFDCSVICGYRGKLAQETAFREGTTTKHWPDSKHNVRPALAVDVAPFPIQWKNKQQFLFFAGYVKGVADFLYRIGRMTKQIKVGADWNQNMDPADENFTDLPHFEVI